MFTGNEATRRVALWGVVVAVMLTPLMIVAQEDVPATEGDAADDGSAVESPPGSNPTQRSITPRNDQSPAQQRADQWECYDQACEQTAWDPYVAYDELVAAGYAVILTREEMEAGLISRAADGAEIGAVAGEIVGEPREGAEIGAAIAVAREVLYSDYLVRNDDPEAQRAVSRFERNLRNWDRKFAACLRPKGYGVSSP